MKNYIVLALILCFLSAKSQEPVTGMQYKNATENSLDVVNSHLVLYQAQAQYNKTLNYFSYTTHVGKGLRLLLNDGSVVNGDITRVTIPLGVGIGSVDKLGVFMGLNNELQLVRSFENSNIKSDVIQMMFFMGISCLGFQADYGAFFGKGFSLDGNGEFAANINQMANDNSSKFSSGKIFFSVFHQSGCYFSAIYTSKKIGSTANFTLSEFKFSLQPLKKFLPDIYGNPYLNLMGYTPLSSYAAKYRDFYDKTFLSNSEDLSQKRYDFEPGSNNINKKGINAALGIQIHPHIAFQKIEVAYNYFRRQKSQVFGIKTQLYRRDNEANISFDAFITQSVLRRNITASLSYSYNSPDNVTFLPLPKLHVIGIQLIFGKRETAQAIIPYAASVMSDEMSGFENPGEARNRLKDNVKEGKWIEYLDANNNFTTKKEAVGYYLVIYKDGKPTKVTRQYSKSNDLLFEGEITEFSPEKYNGLCKWYSKNEKLTREANYKNGKLNGLVIEYSEKGKPLKETNYVDDNIFGPVKEFDEKGNLKP